MVRSIFQYHFALYKFKYKTRLKVTGLFEIYDEVINYTIITSLKIQRKYMTLNLFIATRSFRKINISLCNSL